MHERPAPSLPSGEEEEEESAMASAEEQKESELQVGPWPDCIQWTMLYAPSLAS